MRLNFVAEQLKTKGNVALTNINNWNETAHHNLVIGVMRTSLQWCITSLLFSLCTFNLRTWWIDQTSINNCVFDYGFKTEKSSRWESRELRIELEELWETRLVWFCGGKSNKNRTLPLVSFRNTNACSHLSQRRYGQVVTIKIKAFILLHSTLILIGYLVYPDCSLPIWCNSA